MIKTEHIFAPTSRHFLIIKRSHARVFHLDFSGRWATSANCGWGRMVILLLPRLTVFECRTPQHEQRQETNGKKSITHCTPTPVTPKMTFRRSAKKVHRKVFPPVPHERRATKRHTARDGLYISKLEKACRGYETRPSFILRYNCYRSRSLHSPKQPLAPSTAPAIAPARQAHTRSSIRLQVIGTANTRDNRRTSLSPLLAHACKRKHRRLHRRRGAPASCQLSRSTSFFDSHYLVPVAFRTI